MGSIWGFLLQTLTVSLVALLLLTLKLILKDNLSPRWQYGVWGLLALRIVIPVNSSRYVLIPINLWLELLKSIAERGLGSAYSAEYVPIRLRHVLPTFDGAPRSVTDWLLIAYALGIAVYLLWHIVSYARLRLLLHRGDPISAELQNKIGNVCERHGLKSCNAVAIKGLPSAFICGIIHPVLVLPSEGELDDKVLLHELLHLKHHDALQSVFWCVLRSLHWCNPFMIYVFNRVGNDMESLCDQRVLERLEGEERREYGKILLGMANERYARAPGTSSISNGGANISRRIDAIVRFKKYPAGMALVSVCIVIVLISPLMLGTANAYSAERYRPESEVEFAQAMAAARINRCTTVAGAIDTYAKGLMSGNGIYIATVSPLSEHEALAAEMRQNPYGASHYFEYGKWLEGAQLERSSYAVYNIAKNADGSLRATLVIESGILLGEDGSGNLTDEEGHPLYARSVITLSIWYEDCWLVRESGERELSIDQRRDYGLLTVDELSVQAQTGKITISVGSEYRIDNSYSTSAFSFWASSQFDSTLKLDAQFYLVNRWTEIEYSCAENGLEIKPTYQAGIQLAELDSPEEDYVFPERAVMGNESGSSSDGNSWASHVFSDDSSWSGYVYCGYRDTDYDVKQVPIALPAAYKIQIIWDNEVVEELVIEGVQQ